LKFLAAIVCAMVAAFAVSAARADDPAANTRYIPGYYDPGTGIFTGLPQSSTSLPQSSAAGSNLSAPPATAITGKLVIKVSIDVDPTICGKETLTAMASALIVDPNYGGGVSSPTPLKVGACAGGKAGITFEFPFHLDISSASDVMTVAVSVFAGPSNNPLSQLTATLPLPKNGINKISLPEGI
jgi:hypothetical protein